MFLLVAFCSPYQSAIALLKWAHHTLAGTAGIGNEHNQRKTMAFFVFLRNIQTVFHFLSGRCVLESELFKLWDDSLLQFCED